MANSKTRPALVPAQQDDISPAEVSLGRAYDAETYAPAAPSEANIDICSFMFDFCRRCQDELLDRLGLTCMFDVDGGQVPAWMGQILQAIVDMLITDIANGMTGRLPGAAVGVTLRRAGSFWALAVAENVSGAAGPVRATRRLTMVRALTDRLECICRVLPNPSGSTIAMAFPAHSAPGRDQASLLTNRVLH